MKRNLRVMITGACGGLGRVLAGECARRGYWLFLTDIRQPDLDTLAQGLARRFGARADTWACDLTDDAAVNGLFAFIDARGLAFDMLLNVAGIDFEGGFLQRERQRLLDIVSLNIEATLRVTHAMLTRRRQGVPFYLVFVSSLASLYPMPLKATYAASKRFLLDFSIALRQELRGEGVRVLALCPGGLATTAEAMRGIAAQGVWGQVTTNRLERVARRTVDKALANRAVYIPGAINRLLARCGRLAPAGLVAALLHRRWQAARGHSY
ncbi:MAG: SDR family NAD(P)-dependent oxidoreductase [Oscillospiraceae bacterium]|jgi:short-subunit dehydrogenase|nr:SDR family NAD(P)-dependent oxidoreductase [Oscillospiraceae bacterium]